MNLNDEMSFFKNHNKQIKYNAVCRNCPKDCKQSFRAKLLSCPELKKEECENDQ